MYHRNIYLNYTESYRRSTSDYIEGVHSKNLDCGSYDGDSRQNNPQSVNTPKLPSSRPQPLLGGSYTVHTTVLLQHYS